MMKSIRSPARVSLLGAFALSLAVGLAYYALFRHSDNGFYTGLSDPTHGTLPSFVHMASLTWLTMALMGHRLQAAAQLIVLVLLSTWTGEWLLGYYDPNDLLAALLGTVTAFGTGLLIFSCDSEMQKLKPLSRRSLAAVGLLTCSTVFITGTSPPRDYTYHSATPVYMSYAELRSSVAIEPPRELDALGRIYLYNNYIFINKRNKGIHILDNSDPKNPVNLKFIAIPGTTEISIRDNYLYADSYIDLVTIDLNNPEQIQEVSRQQEIFPYDEYQSIPEDIHFSSNDLDPAKGVVITYVK
jgi:hypothetical protein